MKLGFKIFAAVAAFSIIGSAFSQQVTGNWKGKIVVDASKMAKPTDPSQKSMMESAMAMMKSITLRVNFKPNKTFAMNTTGLPQNAGAKNMSNAEGTWTQKGNVITMKITKQGGKAPTGANKPQTLTVSKDGKTLTMMPPSQNPMAAKVVFARG